MKSVVSERDKILALVRLAWCLSYHGDRCFCAYARGA